VGQVQPAVNEGQTIVLARYACRVLPPFSESPFHRPPARPQHPQMLHDIRAQVIPHGISIPGGAIQKLLEAIRSIVVGSIMSPSILRGLEGFGKNQQPVPTRAKCSSKLRIFSEGFSSLCHLHIAIALKHSKSDWKATKKSSNYLGTPEKGVGEYIN
jgi:hypothetical protein